jgi:Glucose-6-phosphate dehydrogenase subunit N-terminal domain/Glucose-6-phosphate dehydrogenase subunit C-terminal domain
MAAAAHVEEWTGEDVSLAEIERALRRLRRESCHETEGPDLRTSVMTHIAWAPPRWHEAAWKTLEGLAERHPSRCILLVPGGAPGEDDLVARVQVAAYALAGERRHVAAEIVELKLGSGRARAPASIVMPLLISGLPVFSRWRGRPPFGEPALDELAELADRLIVDSGEWDDPAVDYELLAALFDDVAVSDIAWRRTLPWRLALARDWPEIGRCSELRVGGPAAEALLLAGWLRDRLGHDVKLEVEPAEELESVFVDGRKVEQPPAESLDASELLSAELETFSRDRVYEAAVRAT